MYVRRLNGIQYKELSRAKIHDKRSLVISEATKNGSSSFTIAQAAVIEENGKKSDLFYKGAIIIDSIESLISVRDAINMAIREMNDGKVIEAMKDSDDEDW